MGPWGGQEQAWSEKCWYAFVIFSFYDSSVSYTSYVGFTEFARTICGYPGLNPSFKLTKGFTSFETIREHWVPDFRTKGSQWLFPFENRFNIWTSKSITWSGSIFITYIGKKFLHKWWTQVMLNLEHLNCYLVNISVMKSQWTILFQQFIKWRNVVLIHQPQCSLVNMINLIVHLARAKHPD